LLAAAALAACETLAIAAKEPEPRKIALRLSEGVPVPAALEALGDRAKGRGIELQVASEGTSVPRGFEVAHLTTLAPPDALRAALSHFPLSVEGTGFTFDGRAYSGKEDALYLVDPARPSEAFVLGASLRAALELAAEMLLERSPRTVDYLAISG